MVGKEFTSRGGCCSGNCVSSGLFCFIILQEFRVDSTHIYHINKLIKVKAIIRCNHAFNCFLSDTWNMFRTKFASRYIRTDGEMGMTTCGPCYCLEFTIITSHSHD